MKHFEIDLGSTTEDVLGKLHDFTMAADRAAGPPIIREHVNLPENVYKDYSYIQQ